MAGTWAVPLLAFDMGKLYNKYHGETERNLRRALDAATKMAPCVLWIDEIEKGLSISDTDSGASFVSGVTGPSVEGYGDGSAFSSFTFQIGTRSTANDQTRVDIAAGTHTDIAAEDLLDQTGAQSAIEVMDRALDLNNRGRARIGSRIRALGATADHLSSAIMNYGQSISQIADTDMAEESAIFAREQVMRQAGVAMLAQANQQPNLVLRLLG